MLINSGITIYQGSTPLVRVYQGRTIVWERQTEPELEKIYYYSLPRNSEPLEPQSDNWGATLISNSKVGVDPINPENDLYALVFNRAPYQIPEYAFANDYGTYYPVKMKRLIIPTYTGRFRREILQYAFYRQSFIDGIELTSPIYGIFEYAFHGCEFSILNLPPDVRNIFGNAFSNNPNLTEIHIGGNISTLEYNAFGSCPNLSTIYFNQVNPPTKVSGGVFNNVSNIGVFHIPQGADISTWRNTYTELETWEFVADL